MHSIFMLWGFFYLNVLALQVCFFSWSSLNKQIFVEFLIPVFVFRV